MIARPTRPPLLRVLILAVLAAALAGCGNASFYAQSISGHLRLMSEREDIAGLIADPATPDDLRRRLTFATEMQAFAVRELALPDNGSYRSYVDVGRGFVVLNVVATPELSLDPVTWCFPITGCIAYRGYFDPAEAEAFGQGLADEGLDVALIPASAYSTLGWFDDPIVSTLLFSADYRVAGTIFHEMAHQRVYVAGDSTFNESYAVAVEREGVRRWIATTGDRALLAAWETDERRQQDFLDLVLGTRTELDALYRSALDEEAKRAGKERIFAAMQDGYQRLRASWGGYAGYDNWFARDLNNAHLALVATYNQYVPAFENLLDEVGHDMAAFHAAVERLAALPPTERAAELARLGQG